MGDQDLENDFEDDELEGDGAGSGDGSQDGDPKGETSEEKKRYQGAMSALEKERTRARDLARELEKFKSEGRPPSGAAPDKPAVDPELIEDWREAAWERYPQLKDNGIEIDAIAGGTRAEIRAQAAALVAFIEKVETKVRNRVLAEYGLSSAGIGGGGDKVPDFGAMSDEDFLKLINKRGM